MRVLITGICGFVGHTLACALHQHVSGLEIFGVDSLIRPGSERNRPGLASHGIRFQHGDIRSRTDVESLPAADWVIDAAANASVLAGIEGDAASRQLVEHNLGGTVNLLEYCKRHHAGFVLLSTSRVYSIEPLARLEVESVDRAFMPRLHQRWPTGASPEGIGEDFSTHPPVSLYGSTKAAAEILALEYGAAFDFPIRINRCGVMAGAGQFGRADQGIFSYWIHAYASRRPLRYIGFDGTGQQVRDCLHPRDLAPLLARQMNESRHGCERPLNAAGGVANSMSLAQLSDWCAARFGRHPVQPDGQPRPFDVPWLVLDAKRAKDQWQWQPTTALEAILVEIAKHAEDNPNWLDISSA